MTDAEFAQLLTDMVRTAERFLEIDSRLDVLPAPPELHEIRRELNLKG